MSGVVKYVRFNVLCIIQNKQNNEMKSEALNIGMVAIVLIGIVAIGVVFVQQVIAQGIVW